MTNYFQSYKTGIGSVGAYQVSAVPWVSSSLTVTASGATPREITFPSVTSFILVRNDGAQKMRVGFSANGVKNKKNYIVLPSSGSLSGDWKVRSVFLLSDAAAINTAATVMAGLTGISPRELVNQTTGYLNWSGSIGVG